MAKPTIHEHSYALHRSYYRIQRIKMDDTRGYYMGYVSTPSGMVGVYAQYGGGDVYTILSKVANGREYRRTVNGRCLVGRSLSIAANKFAKERAQ